MYLQDIYESKRYIKTLSWRTAPLTALALFDLLNLAVFGLYDLEAVNENVVFLRHEQYFKLLSAVAAGLNCISWLILVIVPFIQVGVVFVEDVDFVSVSVWARPKVWVSVCVMLAYMGARLWSCTYCEGVQCVIFPLGCSCYSRLWITQRHWTRDQGSSLCLSEHTPFRPGFSRLLSANYTTQSECSNYRNTLAELMKYQNPI